MKATIETAKIIRGPQGGRYWGFWLRAETGEVVVQDGGYTTKKAAVAHASKIAAARGIEVS